MSLSTRIPKGAVASVTHNGPRANNEDRELIVTFPEDLRLPILAVLAVADGAGGGDAGEVASQIAIQRLQERVNQFIYVELQDAHENMSRERLQQVISHLLSDTIDQLHREIRESAKNRSATTLTTVFVCDGYLVSAHVGDSRLYVGSRSGLAQLSLDQRTPDSGAPLSLGSARIDPQTDVQPIYRDSIVMVCTDGVSDVLNEEDMTDILTAQDSLNDGANALISNALERGTQDNCTVAMAVYGDYQRALPARRRARRTAPLPGSLPGIEGEPAPDMSRKIHYSDPEPPPPRGRGMLRWIPVAILGAMMIVASGIAWLLYDPSEGTQLAATEEIAAEPAPDSEPSEAELHLEALMRQFADQDTRVFELEAQIKAAQEAGDAETQALETSLERLLGEQAMTQKELSSTQESLRQAKEKDVQEIAEIHDFVDSLEEEERRKLEDQQKRVESEKQAKRAVDIENSALSFEHQHRRRDQPTPKHFNTSMFLRLPGRSTGENLWLVVGRETGGRLEVVRARRIVIEKNKDDYLVFGEKGWKQYRTKLQDGTWSFFLLTPFGYEKINRPREGNTVTIHYDFLMDLPHKTLTYEDPN